MRIGIITYDFRPPIGGLGVVADQMARHLRSAYPANDYIVFSPSKDCSEQVSQLARWRWNARGGCPLFSLTLLWTLPRIIRDHRLDVLHVHSGSGGVWLLRKPSCPLVVTAHHSYAQEAASVFGTSPLKRAWKRLMSALERRTYRLADHVTCVSEDTKQVLLREYGVDPRKVCVVENAVDLAVFKPAPSFQRKADVVLFAGRLETRKGIWVLVRAMAAIRERIPGVRFRFVGENLAGRRLHDVIRQQGMAGVCEFLGRVHEPYLVREMQMCTAIVVPSLIEGFGLIAAEAMACGCCVVASDCDGLRSIIKQRETGMLFPSGDSRACADALIHVLSDVNLRERLSAAAAKDAAVRFDFHRQAAEMQHCLDRVLSEKK